MIFNEDLSKKILECDTKREADELQKEIREECEFWRTEWKLEGIKDGKNHIKRRLRELLDVPSTDDLNI